MPQRLEDFIQPNPDLTVGQQIQLREMIDDTREKVRNAKTPYDRRLWATLAGILIGVLGYEYF